MAHPFKYWHTPLRLSALAALIVMPLLAYPATAAAEQAASPGAGVPSGVFDDPGGADYWTPERMAEAKPADVHVPPTLAKLAPVPSRGPEMVVEPEDPDPSIGGDTSAGEEAPQQARPSLPCRSRGPTPTCPIATTARCSSWTL